MIQCCCEERERSSSVYRKETLKTVLKSVVAEEDRSRNLVVYGLKEEEGEQLSALVSEVLEELDEKPRFEACRVGRKAASSPAIRPVKITLPSSTAAHQILMKTGRLRLVEKLKAVFICPDRSSEAAKNVRRGNCWLLSSRRCQPSSPTEDLYPRWEGIQYGQVVPEGACVSGTVGIFLVCVKFLRLVS